MSLFNFSKGEYLLFLYIILTLCTLFNSVKTYKVGNDPFRGAAFLDPQEKYHLEWFVDHTTNRISFSLTVQTRGWILFGLADNDGDRTAQDVVIGGVLENGLPYFTDSHTRNFDQPLINDINQDYILESFYEKHGSTFLKFSRALDTCDHEDYPITESKITLIWAYGYNDNLDGNFNRNYINRGTYDIYLLDPEYTPSPQEIQSDTSIQTWTISSSLHIPDTETSYICTIRKAPRLPDKHHIIGYNVKFDNEQSRILTHHLIFHRFRAPKGISPYFLFEPFARSGEYQTCYSNYHPSTDQIPRHFCTQVYYGWALGGREFFLPDHVGIPFNEDPNQDEYYMLQAHYDNQQQLSNLLVGLQVEVFYTQNLRANDGGVMFIGHDIPGLPESLLIPPKTPNLQVYGHCSRECTKRMLPQQGITMVTGVLHSHTSGKKLKLHHFRGNKELPWILYDDNYDNGFQQNRGLPREEVTVLPGDQLVMECTYDNTWTNETIGGGYRTRQEMCLALMTFYGPLPEYSFCRSGIISPYLRERFFGVRNVTWRQSRLDWVSVDHSPRRLVGRTIAHISDNVVDWNQERRSELQEVYKRFPQVGSCNRDVFSRDLKDIEVWLRNNVQTTELMISGDMPLRVNTKDEFSGPVEYPYGAADYHVPESSCGHKDYV